MNFKNLYYLIFIIYLIPFSFAYSIDRPDIKNLIIHKNKKKIEKVEFLNSKSQKLSLKNYDSKGILINFWATWCAPCKEEMPSLDKLKINKEFNNIEILPINIGREKINKIKNFYKDNNIENLEIFLGSKNKLPKQFQIRGLPTTILIDKNGYEFARIIGYIDFENKTFLNWLISQI